MSERGLCFRQLRYNSDIAETYSPHVYRSSREHLQRTHTHADIYTHVGEGLSLTSTLWLETAGERDIYTTVCLPWSSEKVKKKNMRLSRDTETKRDWKIQTLSEKKTVLSVHIVLENKICFIYIHIYLKYSTVAFFIVMSPLLHTDGRRCEYKQWTNCAESQEKEKHVKL